MHILDRRLEFLAGCPELRESVNRDWLNSLEVSRKKSRELVSLMEDIVLRMGENWFYTVVGTKLQNPLCNTAELADMCQLSPGSVSRYLKSYTDQALRFVSVSSENIRCGCRS